MRKFGKLLMIVACLAMVFSLSAGVSAAELTGTATTITLNLQEVNRAGTSPVTSEIETFTFSALSTDTLKAALDKAVADTNNKLTYVEWSTVVIYEEDANGNWVATDKTGYVLESLIYDGETYANETVESTNNSYKGTAWSYFFGTGTTPSSSWDYPTSYLNQVLVSDLAGNNYGLTLSHEYSEMEW